MPTANMTSRVPVALAALAALVALEALTLASPVIQPRPVDNSRDPHDGEPFEWEREYASLTASLSGHFHPLWAEWSAVIGGRRKPSLNVFF